MTTDIYTVSGRSRKASQSLHGRVARGIQRKPFWAEIRGVARCLARVGCIAGVKGVMDRIAISAFVLLALGLWAGPYITGTADPTAHPSASAKSLNLPVVPAKTTDS